MELISREDAIKCLDGNVLITEQKEAEAVKEYFEMIIARLKALSTIEERKVGEWIRTGRTNVYGGEELMCPFCGDRVMVQYIEYELYCRQCGALLGDRVMKDEGE